MENKKLIVAIAGAVAVIGAAYYLLQPVPVTEEEKKPQARRTAPTPKPPSPSKPPPQKKVEVIEEPRLSLENYINYLKIINQIALEKFTKLKKDFITARRASQTPEEYQIAVRIFKAAESQVMDVSLKEVLEQEKVNKNAFEAARIEFLNKHEVATERESLKQALAVGKAPDDLDVEQLKVIMQTEIKMLADANNTEDEVKNIETISRIEDRIFEEFAYEISDIRAAAVKFQGEVKGLSRQIIRNYQKFKL